MAAGQFFVNSSSQDFKSRQKDVFSALAPFEATVNLSQSSPQHTKVDNELQKYKNKKNRKITRALRGQESLFKAPGSPPLKPRMPDFRRNPQRWTKYSLADVSADDTSERSNTAAAMDFLRSRQLQNQTLNNDQNLSKIQFNKTKRSTRIRVADDEQNNEVKAELADVSKTKEQNAFGEVAEPVVDDQPDKPVFVQNKLIMPEYVVGERSKKPKKISRPTPQKSAKELTLSHLMDYED